MTHARATIRENFVSLLTGLTTTGSNVFASRIWPLTASQLPGLLIYSEAEESEESSNGRALLRRLTILIDARVKATDGAIDNALDTIAEEIETAVEADPTLSGAALFTILESTEFEFNNEQSDPVGVMQMRYRVDYRT